MSEPAPVLVVGAAGEVGEGIVSALLGAGRKVVAAGRSAEGLQELARRLDDPAKLLCVAGSLASEAEAHDLAKAAGPVHSVVVAVNGKRQRTRLAQLDPPSLGRLLESDLLTHFTAIRTFLPQLGPTGCFIGIGGGSADFILDGGVYMSMAQAALRQMYRGFALERTSDKPALRELIVASVVAGRNHSQNVDPLWIRPDEIGALVAAMIDRPTDFPGAIWRISRRDEMGRPVIGREEMAPARVLPL